MFKARTAYTRCLYSLLILSLVLNTLFFTQASPSRASTLQALTLGQLSRLSALVFEGKVLSKEVIEDEKGRIWTQYQLEVIELWKGKKIEKNSLLELTILGGSLGEGVVKRTQVIHGQVQLEEAQQGVFFLEKTAQGQYVFTGMSQGFYEIIELNGQLWAKREVDEQHLYAKVSAQSFASVQYSPNFKPLNELKSLVIHGAKKVPSLQNRSHEIYPVKVRSKSVHRIKDSHLVPSSQVPSSQGVK